MKKIIIFIALLFLTFNTFAIGELTPFYVRQQQAAQAQISQQQLQLQQLEIQRQKQTLIQNSMNKCRELGFQAQTAEFNNCVVTLAK
jgi:hypothetical protein